MEMVGMVEMVSAAGCAVRLLCVCAVGQALIRWWHGTSRSLEAWLFQRAPTQQGSMLQRAKSTPSPQLLESKGTAPHNTSLPWCRPRAHLHYRNPGLMQFSCTAAAKNPSPSAPPAPPHNPGPPPLLLHRRPLGASLDVDVGVGHRHVEHHAVARLARLHARQRLVHLRKGRHTSTAAVTVGFLQGKEERGRRQAWLRKAGPCTSRPNTCQARAVHSQSASGHPPPQVGFIWVV